MYLLPEVDKDPFQEGILFLKDKDLVYLPTMVILMFQEILFRHVFVLLESSGGSNRHILPKVAITCGEWRSSWWFVELLRRFPTRNGPCCASSTIDSILSYFEISPNGQDWTRFKRAWLWYRHACLLNGVWVQWTSVGVWRFNFIKCRNMVCL